MSLEGWQPSHRIARYERGSWYVVRRAGLYRDAAHEALLWRPGPDRREAAERWIAEAGALAERVPAPFQRVLERGSLPEPYLIVERVDAVPLRRLLCGAGALAAARAGRVGLALCDAVARLHATRTEDGAPLGVLAHGLGADTVWLTPGEVRIANPLLLRPAHGALRGEGLDFLAPELARGERREPETDVHAIGLCVLALLLGRSPLRRGDGMETLRAVERMDLEAGDLDAAPGPLREVLMRALDRAPNKRPFDPAQLGAQLRAAGVTAEPLDLRAALVGVAPEPCGLAPLG